MKYTKLILFLALVATPCFRATAEIGCMDKSSHLKEKFDYKGYRYVQCNCPCKKHAISSERGICKKCGHYHDPGRFEILHFTENKEIKKVDRG